MSLRTRLETRTEVFRGEVIEYHVTVWVDHLPEPSQLNPYCEGGRCVAAARDTCEPKPVLTPAPAPVKRRPSKPEYLGSLDLALAKGERDYPACVIARFTSVSDLMFERYGWFNERDAREPRRLRKAMARFEYTLAGVYDTGTLARIAYHFEQAQARMRRGRKAQAAKLWASEGKAAPMTVGAVLGLVF